MKLTDGKKAIKVVWLVFVFWAIAACGGRDQVYRETKLLMGTMVEITVAAASEREARSAMASALEEIERVEVLLSSHRPTSLVAKINREAHASPVLVNDEIYGLLKSSLAYSRAGGGAFDITVWPLMQLWKFERGGEVPPRNAIAEKLPLVGYRNLILDDAERSVGFQVDGMGLDLGAIAKGWAVDRAIATLKERGIRNAIVDAGGDLRIIGGHPGKGYWRIGVQHPREGGRLLLTLDLRDTAIVTSGDYERFFMADGVRYHHLLDPSTGMPAGRCRSVTVLAATATEADALSTAAFVLGPQRGIALLRARPGVRGMIVAADGELHWTDAALERMARR